MLERITFLSNKKLSPETTNAVEEYKKNLSKIHPKAFFVKKNITKSAWDRNYCFRSNFCNLGSSSMGKVMLGFMVINEIPQDCEEMDSNELRIFDNYCERLNISPRPFNIQKYSNDTVKKEEIVIKQLF